MSEPITARGYIPAPRTIPTAIAQKRYTISRGSLMAVRNLTMESAPTIPSDRTTLDVTARITNVPIIVRATRDTPNEREKTTP